VEILFAGHHRPPAFGTPCGWAASRRYTHLNAASSKGAAEIRTIIPAIGHEFPRALFRTTVRSGHVDGLQGVFCQPDLRSIRAIEMKPQELRSCV
jgi:hypothetical protein